MANQPQPQKREIKLADNVPGGEYANLMQASHTKEEFLLMFANVAGPSGRVVGKIIVTPGHIKRIIRALSDNVKMYEDKFGEIKEAVAPAGQEIGFSDK